MAPKAWIPTPTIEKLPLAVRKDLRDNFDTKKEELTTQIQELLKEAYTLSIDPSNILPYAGPDTPCLARTLCRYFEAFITVLESYTAKYERDGKQYFNDAVSARVISLSVNPKGDDADIIECIIKKGIFEILFSHTGFGYNMTSIESYLVPALETVSASNDATPLTVKYSMQTSWEDECEELDDEISAILAMPGVILDTNYEEVFRALHASSKGANRDTKETLGRTIFTAFEAIKAQLEEQGFKGDDMLQEGLAEALTSKTFKLRILPKLNSGNVNETVFEDGVCYLQTTPDNWGYNVRDFGRGIIDAL